MSVRTWLLGAAACALVGCGSSSGTDAGSDSGQAADAGPRDSGTADAGGTDSGTADAGTFDAGPSVDAGLGYVDGGAIWFVDCPVGTVDPNTLAIAPVSNGLLALVDQLDGGAQVARYLGQACALTLDPTYASGTVASDSFGAQLATDSRDHAYAPSAAIGSGTVELDPDAGLVQSSSQAALTLAVSPDGLSLYTAFVSYPAHAMRADAGLSFTRDSSFSSGMPFVNALAVPPTGCCVLAGGTRNATGAGPWQVYRLDGDGGVVAASGSTTSTTTPDSFCTVTALAPCATGFCAADYNCWRISQWDSAGAFVATLQFPDARRPTSLAATDGGQVWVLHAQSQSNGNQLGVLSGIH